MFMNKIKMLILRDPKINYIKVLYEIIPSKILKEFIKIWEFIW